MNLRISLSAYQKAVSQKRLAASFGTLTVSKQKQKVFCHHRAELKLMVSSYIRISALNDLKKEFVTAGS